MQAMKSTGLNASASQVKFNASASQRTVFQSVNGKVRAFQDQKLVLRQSYGASESESEDDEDDDE